MTDREIATELIGLPGTSTALTIRRIDEAGPRALSVTRGPVADAAQFDAHSKLVCFSGNHDRVAVLGYIRVARIDIRRPTPGLNCPFTFNLGS